MERQYDTSRSPKRHMNQQLISKGVMSNSRTLNEGSEVIGVLSCYYVNHPNARIPFRWIPCDLVSLSQQLASLKVRYNKPPVNRTEGVGKFQMRRTSNPVLCSYVHTVKAICGLHFL